MGASLTGSAPTTRMKSASSISRMETATRASRRETAFDFAGLGRVREELGVRPALATAQAQQLPLGLQAAAGEPQQATAPGPYAG